MITQELIHRARISHRTQILATFNNSERDERDANIVCKYCMEYMHGISARQTLLPQLKIRVYNQQISLFCLITTLNVFPRGIRDCFLFLSKLRWQYYLEFALAKGMGTGHKVLRFAP